MKTDNEKEPKFFRWIRAVRAEINRDIRDMTEEEWIAYSNARAQKARDSLPKFTPEEAKRKLHAILYDEDERVPSRRVKTSRRAATQLRTVKTAIKTPARRRKAARQLVHA